MQCDKCGALMIPVLTDKKIQCVELRCSDDGCYWASIEYCVVCGKPTQYKKGDDIEGREGYERGAGQLCNACIYVIQQENK